jgi:hypothetical protein
MRHLERQKCSTDRMSMSGSEKHIANPCTAELEFRFASVYGKRADIHEAFLSLACALICWHALHKSWMPS